MQGDQYNTVDFLQALIFSEMMLANMAKTFPLQILAFIQ